MLSSYKDEHVGLFVAAGNEKGEGLPLTGVSVKAQTTDFIAEVKLTQCYKNSFSEPIEAIYNFPVDCDFVAEYDDGTTVRGVVKEKDQAREEYEKAIDEGKQANLLESVRSDIFTIHIGNLPPEGQVKINISYITYLKAQDDAVAFVLPTCIAPRYSPGTEQHEPSEALALAPPHTGAKLYGLNIEARFKCCSDIKSITSPTHLCDNDSIIYNVKGKEGLVTLTDISMDRDLVLLVEEEKAHKPRACVEVSDDGSVAGFVTIFPKVEFKDVAREIIFVIDRSGSMDWSAGSAGKSQIKQASEALLLFLRSLPTSCTFNIVGFGSRHESLFSEPMPFNDGTLEEASKYAQNLEANFGGTEIMAPLQDVFKQKVAPGVERQVFVLTDGQVSNDLQVFNLIRNECTTTNKKSKPAKCRLFALGIGAGVSRHLVNGMAHAGRGTARFVEGGDESLLRSKVLGQLKQALQPTLDDVSIQWTFAPEAIEEPERKAGSVASNKPHVKNLLDYRSPAADEQSADKNVTPLICPSKIPPIFNGERFLSFAKFPEGMKDVPESVTITCESLDGPLVTTTNVVDEEIFHGSIAHKMAAREAIREFEDGRKGPNKHYGAALLESSAPLSEGEALKLALECNLASEQTSFIAVLERPVVEPGSEAVKEVIPQHLPSYDKDMSDDEDRALATYGALAPQLSLCLGDCAFDTAPTMSMGEIMGPPGTAAQSNIYRSMPMASIRTTSGLPPVDLPPTHPLRLRQALDAAKASRESNESPDKACTIAKQAFDDAIAELDTLSEESYMESTLVMQELQDILTQWTSGTIGSAEPSNKSITSVSSPQIAVDARDESPIKLDKQGLERHESLLSGDHLMQLCLLQTANGSFCLDDNLASTIGLSPDTMKRMANEASAMGESNNSPLSLDATVFATLLAVAVMRKKFASLGDIWALQEGKALDFVRKKVALLDEEVEAFIVGLQAAV
eukprot:CAMPEP_0197438938 /NCGR_PEP_ID=MMETSP1175-20131217/5801_1 /TAXON_ID=1003142 /ORGANISM="Triceratium dubium, Strain CCMP147" /LENGTH=965 /DNA_ID=CAMNT_0042968759 /DNA_START=104 /DNA_END=3001 /DNA_ORIENTATION=+